LAAPELELAQGKRAQVDTIALAIRGDRHIEKSARGRRRPGRGAGEGGGARACTASGKQGQATKVKSNIFHWRKKEKVVVGKSGGDLCVHTKFASGREALLASLVLF